MGTFQFFKTLRALCASVVVFLAATGYSQSSPYRGLWVGTAGLESINEVSTSLNDENIPVAENPEVPTPAFDRADLRIIIHVNGAGQASLLKDVAIVNRNAGSSSNAADRLVGNESDVSLVTDPELYLEFPPQPAVRIASAVFDFGDSKPTEILNEIVETAATEAAEFVMGLDPLGEPLTARTLTVDAITPSLIAVVTNADVSARFDAFLELFDNTTLTAIAADTNAPVVATLTASAEALRDSSSYEDTRGIELVQAVVDTVAANPTNAFDAAVNMVASFRDVGNLYQRYISGNQFGDMISAGAIAAAEAAVLPGASLSSIETAIRTTDEGIAALAEALQVNALINSPGDTRTDNAVDGVLAAMASAALSNAGLPASDIEPIVEEAGRSALADMVARYPVPGTLPTLDYLAFVGTNDFLGLPATSSEAAAQAAVEERNDNVLFSSNSVYGAAKLAVIDALKGDFLRAARAARSELPLTGNFGPGEGDARLVRDLPAPSDLGPPALTGRIFLPQRHPTNPFRHRIHPDHAVGFDIERFIRIDFDGSASNSLEAAGFGVDRLTGIYREEIFGLHKPLGQVPSQRIGLKTEGPFNLQRISFIDTLNTR